MVATVLALMAQQAYDQTPPWKAYVEQVEKAYAMEIRWSKLTKPAETYIGHGAEAPSTRTFTLLIRKPNSLSFEEPNVSKVIWNGSAGIELDLKAKTFKRIAQRPHLEEAQFLYLPLLSGLKGNGGKPTATVTPLESNGSWWHTVSFKSPGVDAGIGYDYMFSERTSLLSFARVEHRGMVKWRGVLEYRIRTFDVERMILTSEFSVEPPKGFRAAGGKGGEGGEGG